MICEEFRDGDLGTPLLQIPKESGLEPEFKAKYKTVKGEVELTLYAFGVIWKDNPNRVMSLIYGPEKEIDNPPPVSEEWVWDRVIEDVYVCYAS